MPGELRASDAERAKAVALLEHAYGEGRLTLPEFEERVTAAHGARTRGELSTLTADLPHSIW